MASGESHQHGSVAASPVTVTIPAGTSVVRVINRAGTAELAVTTSGATPSLTGNNKVLPASVGTSAVVDVEGGSTAVKLLSDATGTTYSVWAIE